MTTDQKLLELAAKAVGYTIHERETYGALVAQKELGTNIYGDPLLFYWSPLQSDGDAFRLAVTLRLDIEHSHPADQERCVYVRDCRNTGRAHEEFDDESKRPEATRRAIVRAAAEIWRNMP